jgi:hypothetical protein
MPAIIIQSLAKLANISERFRLISSADGLVRNSPAG